MGRQPCCDKVGLKKGPWTAEEDKKLINFILTNGQCCWRAVPKLAGLHFLLQLPVITLLKQWELTILEASDFLKNFAFDQMGFLLSSYLLWFYSSGFHSALIQRGNKICFKNSHILLSFSKLALPLKQNQKFPLHRKFWGVWKWWFSVW